MRAHRVVFTLIAVSWSSVAAERAADACSVLACNGDTLPEAGPVPIGVRGFYVAPGHWSFGSTSTTSPAVALVDGDGHALATRVEPDATTGTWAVLLETPLTSPTTLSLTHPASCAFGSLEETTTVTASIAVPYPTSLGTLSLSGPYAGDWVELTLMGADCGPIETLATWVRVDLAADPAARAWERALRVRVELDGVLVNPRGPAPRAPQESYAAFHGLDRVNMVVHPCSAGPVTRRVALVADSPGYPALRTNTVEVTLECATPATDAGVERTDGFVSDTGTSDGDAGARPDSNDLPGDAAPDGGPQPDATPARSDAGALEEEEDGCTCVAGEPRGAGRGGKRALVGLALFGLVAFGRVAFGRVRVRRASAHARSPRRCSRG
ncbi:hypothetical protein L6R52_16105 [Myxococcota bacterium]|nr:hypothetical protein [Myxococcota bacterium]